MSESLCNMCAHRCGGLRSIFSFFGNGALLYLLRNSLSVEPRVHQWTSLVCSLLQDAPESCLLNVGIIGSRQIRTLVLILSRRVFYPQNRLSSHCPLILVSSSFKTLILKVSKSPRICFCSTSLDNLLMLWDEKEMENVLVELDKGHTWCRGTWQVRACGSGT